MKLRRQVWVGMAVGLVLVLSAQGFAQVQPVQNRIPQQVIINGQQANGAYVPASTGMQTFTCPSPQQYSTPDGASQGWACYDYTTSVWLLNALPPSPQPVQQAPLPAQQPQPPAVNTQQPPAVIYQQPAPATVVYAPVPAVVYPAYSPGVFLGAAAINATGRIVSAAILGGSFYRYPRVYYVGRGHGRW